jgi:hypothetical protein
MLVVYKLLIDAGRADISEPLGGFPRDAFQSGIYHLATAPSDGFYDCLDGNCFSDISQENAILKGGELSLAEDVKVKIVSEDILLHMLTRGIELLGSKASMSAEIINEDRESPMIDTIDIFREMIVSDCTQIDEATLEINLKDAAFANSKNVNLKAPPGFGDFPLEVPYGKHCWHKIYRQAKLDNAPSQGFPTVEFEGSLGTNDGTPKFVETFMAEKIDLSTGVIQVSSQSILSQAHEDFELEGDSVEVVAGRGKGNCYNVVSREALSFVIDPLPGEEELLSVCEANVKNWQYNYPQDLHQFGPLPEEPIKEMDEEVSLFRFVNRHPKYLMLRATKNTKFYRSENGRVDTSRLREVSENGTFVLSSIVNKEKTCEEGDCYRVVKFPLGDKVKVAVEGKHLPRWRRSSTGAWLGEISRVSGFITDPDNYYTPIRKEAEKTSTPSISNVDIYPQEGELVAGKAPEYDSNWRLDDFNELPDVMKCSVAKKEKVEGDFYFDSFDDSNDSRDYPVFASIRYCLGMYATLYWRVDDLKLTEDWSLSAMIRTYFGGASESYHTTQRTMAIDENGRVVEREDRCQLRSRYSSGTTDFSFILHPKNSAKYIYCQLGFFATFGSLEGKEAALKLAATPATAVRYVEAAKLLIESYDYRAFKSDIISTIAQLCLDYAVSIDNPSFAEASDAIQTLVADSSDASSQILLKQGDSIIDKVAEACRAANFSVFSDGSTLHSRYLFAGDLAWEVGPKEIIKSSFEVRFAAGDSVATEWDFEANVLDGQKKFYFAPPEVPDFLAHADWPASGKEFNATLDCLENLPNGMAGLRVIITSPPEENLHIGGKYRLNIANGYIVANCELTSITVNNKGVVVLFASSSSVPAPLASSVENASLTIAPLSPDFNWSKAITGNMDVKYETASELWRISQAAYDRTRRRTKLDERYTKHKIAAFGTDKLWVKNFIKTAEHNSYAKHIISFKVPISHLPTGRLYDLLLMRAGLKFAQFKRNPVYGWIVGYSLIVAEDSVRITFINSEPIKDILWLDENLLEDQLMADERELADKLYLEA